MDRANFPDGLDIYVEDLTLIVDTTETELNKRMFHVTVTKGVAEGCLITTQNDQVTIGVGQAYDDVRYRLVVTAPIVVPIVAGDIGKFVVISRVATDTTSQAHPLTGVTSFRRTIESVAAAVVASPTSDQVKLCKITGASPGTPPTVSTIGTDRDVLSVRVIKPYIVVAKDGSGDFSTLEAALASLTSAGGKIYVKAGAYDVTATPVVSVSNVYIEGDGTATKLRVPGDITRSALSILGAGIGSEISDISIRNLQVEYADVYANSGSPVTLPALIKVNHARNVSIENVKFVNSNQKANYNHYGLIAETNALGVNISLCRSSITTRRFVDVIQTKGSDITVEGCDLIGFEGAGIHHNGVASQTVIITGNALTGTVGILSQAGIKLNNGSYFTVANNSVTGCSYGLAIAEAIVAGTVTRGTVSGNVLVSNGKYGVSLLSSGATRFVVDGNVLVDNGGGGSQDLSGGATNMITADNVT